MAAATAAELAEARGWIADCEWGEGPDLGRLTDAQVVRGVQRHYDGGWAGFLADAAPLAV